MSPAVTLEKIIAKEMLNRTCRISCLPNIQNSRGKSSDNTNDKNDKNDGKSQANNTELSSAGDTTDDKVFTHLSVFGYETILF